MAVKNTQLDKLLSILEGEVGYLEKASNSQLDDKTANAGYNNYTKYGAWYGLNGPSAYWCHMVLSWGANQAGISTDIFPKTASCATGRDFFKNKGLFHLRSGYTPKRGDVVYFTTSGYPNGSGHVGLVYKVLNGYIYTIEGNTNSSSRSTVISNGGEVAYKSYTLSNTAIYGYGSPAYLEDEQEDDEVVTQGYVLVNGKKILCDLINKDNANYVKLRSLTDAGCSVVFDDGTKLPAIKFPQQRTNVPELDAEMQAVIDNIKDTFGLEDKTIAYLRRYEYGDELLKKMAAGAEAV